MGIARPGDERELVCYVKCRLAERRVGALIDVQEVYTADRRERGMPRSGEDRRRKPQKTCLNGRDPLPDSC